MQPIISAAQMREIDRLTTDRFGVASLVLMENAASATARAIAQALQHDVAGKAALVFCGKGNNGGDGAATARLLANSGARVDVVLIGSIEEARGDARTNFDRLCSWKDGHALREQRDPMMLEVSTLNLFECESQKGWEQLVETVLSFDHEIIIDALFGTGLTRPVEGLHRNAIQFINQVRAVKTGATGKAALIVSIDLPSGLNADSETPIGETVQADLTVTMTALKRANAVPPAAHFNGTLIVADIGSPAELIAEAKTDLFSTQADDARRWLFETRYTPESYKNTHGHALVIAGSRGFTGAAALCGNAAMRAGAGLVTVATPASAQPLVASQVMPEVMTTALAETDRGAVSDEAIDYALKFAERANVIAIGPGLSAEDERTRGFVHAIVERRKTPVVIDADGLNCLAPWPDELRGSNECPIILTPHPGEMQRLLGADDKSALDDRVAVGRDFARSHEVILVLKGSRAIIAAPDGRVFINASGNAGLGTAGAGDTLTGMITGCLAQAVAYRTASGKKRVNVLDTVIAAVSISGLAGDLAAGELGMRAMVASDIREHLSNAFRLLDPSGESPSRLESGAFE